MVGFLVWGNEPNSFAVAQGGLLDYQNMPDAYEGKFQLNEWNSASIKALHTGPDGYHWALLQNNTWAARGPTDMIPFFQPENVNVGSDGLVHYGRGQATFVAFAPNGVSWFIRYSRNVCVWGPEISTFPSTFQDMVANLEATHPRKDECVDFVAFGAHDLLLVRFENGKSGMILPQNPALLGSISKDLIRVVNERLDDGWTFGNRTTLDPYHTERWFIEFKRGTSAEFRYSLGKERPQDLERVKVVLDSAGSNAGSADPSGNSGSSGIFQQGQLAQLIAANSRVAQQAQLGRILRR